MRRTLAAVLLSLAQLLGAGALAGWWMANTVFDTSRSRDVADVVLRDDGVRSQVAGAIAAAAAAQLGQPEAQVRQVVDQAATTPQGAVVLAEVVVDAHARLIGESDAPVLIEPVQLIPILGEQAVGLPAIEVPVPRIAAFDWMRRALDTFVPIAAIAALVLAVLAFVVHPDKVRLLRIAGVGLLVMAVLVVVLGYVLPAVIGPSLTSSPWVTTFSAIASTSVQLLAGIALVLIGAGVGALAMAGAMRRGQLERQAAMARTVNARPGNVRR